MITLTRCRDGNIIIAMRLLHVLLLCTLSSSYAADSMNFTNQSGTDFIHIPAGQFKMGTKDIDEAAMEHPDGDSKQFLDETPNHPLSINSFYMGKTEVTQKQWLEVMGTRPGPEKYWLKENWQDLPVVTVSWPRVQDFIAVLNKKDDKYRYRLPTEAEWEYVARDGSEQLRPFEIDELDKHAWTISNSGDVPHPVAQLQANGFGIHDLYGNVWEWVYDWYNPDYYSASPDTDPKGPEKATKRVRRGGSYHCPKHLVRAGYRAPDFPDKRYSVLGFRLAAEKIKNQ